MDKTENQTKLKFFEGISYLQEWKPDSNLIVFVYFLSELICQLLLIDYNRIISRESSAENFVFDATYQMSNYVFFSRNTSFKQLDQGHYLSLTILLIMIACYIIMTIVIFQNSGQEWQGQTLQFLYFINKIFMLPFFEFQLQFLQASFLEKKYYFLVLAFICLLMNVVFIYVFEELSFTISLTKRKKFDRNFYVFASKKILITELITCYITIQTSYSEVQGTIFIAAFLLINIIDLFLKMKQIVFFDELTNQLSIGQNVILITFYILALLDFSMDLLRENFLLVNITFSLFFLWAQHTLASYLKYQILIRDINQIQTEDDAMSYMRYFYYAITNYNDHVQSMMLIGLIYDHRQECHDPLCFCQVDDQQEEKQPIYKNQAYLKLFTLTVLNKIKKKFDSSLYVTLNFLSYKIEIMKQYPRMFQELKKIDSEQQEKFLQCFKIHEQFMVYEVWMMIREVILYQMRRQELFNMSQVFEEEVIQKEVIKNIKKILENLSNLYRYLNRAVCNLNSLDITLTYLYELFIIINTLWEKVKNKETKSMEIFNIFYFYYHNVISLSFQEKFILGQIVKIFKKMFINEKAEFQFNYLLFGENGGVVESIIHPEKMGIINRMTRNLKNITGADNQKVIGLSVEHLFFSSFRDEHKKILSEWIDSGKDNILNKTLDVWMLSLRDIAFKAKMTLQILFRDSDLLFELGIIKINDQDYFVSNLNGEIEGCGLKMWKMFRESVRGKNLDSFCSVASDILSNSSKVPKKVFSIFTIFNKTRIFEDMKTQEVKTFEFKNQQITEYFTELQFFTWSIGQKSVIVIKILNCSNKEDISNFEQFEEKMMKGTVMITANRSISQSQLTSKKSTQEFDEKKEDVYGWLQSQSRSSAQSDASFSLEKTMKTILDNALKGFLLSNKPTSIVKFFMFAIFILLFLLILGQIYFFAQGLFSYSEVARASGAVNNNMQMLQLLFNKITKMFQYCEKYSFNKQRCEYIKRSTENLQKTLRKSINLHFQYLNKNKTYFNNHYYQYHLNPLNVEMNKKVVQIQSTQFMEFYLHAAWKISNILEEKGYLDNQASFIYLFLKQNWPRLKEINHKNLKWYEQTGMKEIQTVSLGMIIFFVIYSLIFTGFLAMIYIHYRRNQTKRVNILFIYRLIPLNFIEKLKIYYQDMVIDLDKKSMYEMTLIQYPQISTDHSYKNIEFTFQYSFRIKIILLILWGIVMTFNVIVLDNMLKLFPQCSEMLQNINDIMTAESLMIENYFQLKVYYLEGGDIPYQEFQDLMLETLASNQVLFNKYSLLSINRFASNDKVFLEEMGNLLIQDICKLVEDKFETWEIQKCKNQMHYKILEQGLMPTVTYFQRSLYQALLDLKKQNIDPHEYFKRKVFEDLDDYTIYMNSLYEKIQERILQGLNKALIQSIIFSAILDFFEVLMVLFILIAWLCLLGGENLKLSELNGFIIYFPKIMFKENKTILKTVIQYLISDEL